MIHRATWKTRGPCIQLSRREQQVLKVRWGQESRPERTIMAFLVETSGLTFCVMLEFNPAAGLLWCLSGNESTCPVQEARVPSLIQEDPTFHRTTKAHAPQLLSLCSRAHALQQEKPLHWEAQAPQLKSSPHLPQLEKSPCSKEDPAEPKMNK